jgi:RNA polymerase sigma-70 factor (ECF subfamily)
MKKFVGSWGWGEHQSTVAGTDPSTPPALGGGGTADEDEPFRALIATADRALAAHSLSMRRVHSPVQLVVAPCSRDASDAELARDLAAGSDWAITETWNRFAPAVIMLARRTLGSESEADDVAQEVFYRVFAKAKTLREPDRLRSFVFSFAIRLLKTELRRKRTRAWLSFHQPEALVDIYGEHIDMESRDLLRRFYSLLDRLAPRYRLVFAFRHLESMTVEEIAAHMELSVSTVKRALDRATSKLSRWIEADPGLAGLFDEKGCLR